MASADVKNDVESGKPLMDEGKAAYIADADAVEVSGQPDKFIGLTKEQLEEYRNAPGWRNLRYLLFGLFWLAWIAMFAAAIAIVVTSPPCPEKLKPHWWQSKVAYQVFTPSFKDSDADGTGDVAGITESLTNLQRLSVQTVWPRPLLKSSAGTWDVGAVSSYEEVNPALGTNEDLDALIAAVHAKEMYFVMDLPLATSSEHLWFDKSKSKAAGFEDVYQWSRSTGERRTWARDATRKEYYLHVKGKPEQPVLNLASGQGFAKLAAAMEGLMDRGVDGFYLAHVDYIARSGSNPDWAKTYPILEQLDATLHTYQNTTGKGPNQLILFSGVDATVSDQQRADLVSKGKLAYVYTPSLASLAYEDTTCKSTINCVRDVLEASRTHHVTYADTWPLYELGNSESPRLAERWGSERAVLMEMLLMTLPGAISHYYGDELPLGASEQAGIREGYASQHGVMQWDDTKNAGFSAAGTLAPPQPNADYMSNNFEASGTGPTLRKLFTRLAGLRVREDTLLNGDFELVPVTDGSQALITVRKLKDGAEGKVFFTVLNFANATLAGLDLSTALGAAEAEVVAVSPSVTAYTPRSKAALNDLSFPPLSGAVFRFAFKPAPVPEPEAEAAQ